MSSREIRARERVWERAQRDQRMQWAWAMEGLYLEAKKQDGSRFTRYDWLPDSDRPAAGLGITGREWTTVEEAHRMMRKQDTETQKAALRQMLTFAGAVNEARSQGQ